MEKCNVQEVISFEAWMLLSPAALMENKKSLMRYSASNILQPTVGSLSG